MNKRTDEIENAICFRSGSSSTAPIFMPHTLTICAGISFAFAETLIAFGAVKPIEAFVPFADHCCNACATYYLHFLHCCCLFITFSRFDCARLFLILSFGRLSIFFLLVLLVSIAYSFSLSAFVILT